MSRRLFHFILALVMPLTGCAVGNLTTIITSNPSPAEISGNWQIQSGTPGSPTTTVLMAGSLVQTGSLVTATFQTTPICGTSGVYNFVGSFESSSRALSLSATPLAFYDVNLAVSADPTTYSIGTVQGAGIVCALALSGPGVGVEFAPLTGTYAGTLATNVVYSQLSTPAPGTTSLTLTQSSTPNASGQFPLTGSLSFEDVSCPLTLEVTGTVSGAQFTLASDSTVQPSVTFSGTTNPTATQLQISNLQIVGGPCASTGGLWNGALNAP